MLEVTRLPAQGMVTLRADLSDPRVADALAGVGLSVPDRLRLAGRSDHGAAWFSPDELLLFVADARDVAWRLGQALHGTHHLVYDVTDQRTSFAIRGPAAREVLAKLTPADVHPDALPDGMVRRSRLGQIAAAFWIEDGAARVISFRSTADYMEALLRQSAADGAVGVFG